MTQPLQRLAVVISHPIQYYSPWFRHLASEGWTLRVYYLWNAGLSNQADPEFGRAVVWDVDLLSGYDHEFVPNTAKNPGTDHFLGLVNPELSQRLKVWKPDAILVFGYNYAAQARLIFSTGIPLIFRGDSHLLDRTSPSLLKRWILSLVYSRFAAITYVGRANYDYFRLYGVPPQKLFHAPHCVDARAFAATSDHITAARLLRVSLGLEKHRVVVFAGKLIAKKQPVELLEAFLALDMPASALVFVGEGVELPRLRTLAAASPAQNIHFLPFANQSEMPVRYLLADVFALPSRGPGETWGLAVNEAMHLGVPCLVSDRVGCQRDLIEEGATGWVFPAKSADGLRHALSRALSADLKAMQPAIRERIARHTYVQATAGLAGALTSITSPSSL